MEKKFTDGRWLIDGTRDTVCIDILCNDEVIATCWDDNKHVEELRANAKLISAAPDLFEALLSIENDDNSIPKAIWDMRNASIKKATE